jgi:acyclic terpene utilization AtuA family protein
VRIGNFSGYWGDDPEALARQISGGDLDYLTGDYLAELTMAILERQQRADARTGWAHHFVEQLRPALREIERSGVRLVVNAGGVNPSGCRDAVLRACKAEGVSLPIAIVGGSDRFAGLSALRDKGVTLANADTGAPFERIAGRLLSAHAYLGARPIAEALRLGARIVITGRVTDAALALGPMIHAFGWREDDWDRLSAGMIAGHILECGAQATGGVFTDFEDVALAPEGGRIGYPIVEMEEDGVFTVTKHEESGGLVSPATVAEQLLYEIGDPRAYLSPDVTADFSAISLEEVGHHRVRVRGARGRPPPPEVKLSCIFAAGYRASAHLLVAGPRIRAKAARVEALLGRELDGFADARVDVLGLGALPGRAPPPVEPSEAVLRFAVRDLDRAKVDRFVRVVLGLFVEAPPGVSLLAGRPHTEEAFGFWPALIPREDAIADVEVIDGERIERARVPLMRIPAEKPAPPGAEPQVASFTASATRRAPLRAIAHARSGDKGDRSNIGVCARSERAFAFLCRALTADRVRAHFGDAVHGAVTRHLIPSLQALNFVLDGALGGGGSLSLRPDPLGKAMSDALLEMELDVPEELLVAGAGEAARAPHAR